MICKNIAKLKFTEHYEKIYDYAAIPVLWITGSHILESGCVNHKYILHLGKFKFENVSKLWQHLNLMKLWQ